MMYAVIVPGKKGSASTKGVVDDMEKALQLAAPFAVQGEKPLIFQQVEGEVVLTARIVQNGTKPASFDRAKYARRAPAHVAKTNGAAATTGTTNGHTPSDGPLRIGSGEDTREPGTKRTAEGLAKLRTRILSWVATHPESKAEEISAGLSLQSKDLMLPLRVLLREKKLRKKGQARATKYSLPKTGASKE